MDNIISHMRINKNNLIVSFVAVFTFTVFAPMEIYFSNSDEIWMDIYDILPMCAIAFFSAFFLIFAVLLVLSVVGEVACDLWGSFVVSLTIILYVLGNFVPTHASMMDDGGSIDWSNITDNLIDVTVIVITLVVLFFILMRAGERRSRLLAVISVCLLVLQVYTLLFVSLVKPGNGWAHRNQADLTEKNLFTYSTESNYTILILDQFDARVFSELLDSGNENIKALDGFTYYPDTVCKYNFTGCAVPHIISGKEFVHQSDFDTYLEDAYSHSAFLTELADDGYSVNVYTYDVPGYAVEGKYDNCVRVNAQVSSHKKLIMYIYRLVGCKYLPFWFKQFCWFPSDDLEDIKEIEGVDGVENFNDLEIQPVNYANTNFYKKMKYMTITDRKMFHFIHLRGIHGPWSHDEYMQDVEQSGEMVVAKGVLFLLDEWIDGLKRTGVYDNNVIIIMADHGSAEGVDEDDRSQNALLLIKGVGEHHELEISSNRVSYDQLKNIYDRLLSGESANKAVDDFTGDRTFFKCEKYKYADGDLTEYCVDGYAWEVDKKHETGTVYSTKK